jgi:quinolinate synthase
MEIIKRAEATEAAGVLVCGAVFMTGEIRRRRPDLPLITPRGDLSCPLAEAVSPAEAAEAIRRHPEALVVADVKATPEIKALADLQATPETAAATLARTAGRELIMLPGAYLADLAGYGERVVHRWPKAVCQVHELALPEDLAAARAEHPRAPAAVNMLCRPEVRAMADFVGDAAGIRRFCAESRAREFIVVSEAGLAEFLSETLPGKIFYETEAEIFCPNMKLTNLKTIITALAESPDPSRLRAPDARQGRGAEL